MKTPRQTAAEQNRGTQSESQRAHPLVVHVTTVGMSLRAFLSGQPGAMRSAGFDVQAVSSPGEDLVEFGRAEAIKTYGVRMTRRITPLRDLVAVAKLYLIFRRLRPEIVHAHTPKGGLMGMLAAKLARVPIRIYHIHGLPFVTRRGVQRWLLKATERAASGCATRVLCVSRSVRDVVVAEGLGRKEPGVLLSGSINGVDARHRFSPDVAQCHRDSIRESLNIGRDALVIGYVGRIVRDKGMAELAAAWRDLRGLWPGAILLLVGPFEAEDRVSPEVEVAFREDTRVRLRGPDWNTPPLYAAMDVVVLPSYREGLPFVPLEAAAMEIPVVATRVPGCVDAVRDGVTGTLVEPRDSAGLARAIGRYLKDRTLALTHGKAGRKWVLREFDRQAIWSALAAEYRRLLAEARVQEAEENVVEKSLPRSKVE